jgi:hypothetical protein
MASSVDFTDRRSSARTTSKDDLGFMAPLVPVKPSDNILSNIPSRGITSSSHLNCSEFYDINEPICKEEIFLKKSIFNLLIYLLIKESKLSLNEINSFILLINYDKLSSTNNPAESKTDIDTTELFTTLFGNKTTLDPKKFDVIFVYWYKNIYNTPIGNIIKDVMIACQNDEIIKIILFIINEFEVFVGNKKHEDRVTNIEEITGGGGNINFIKFILLMISCLLVFAPNGNFTDKKRVQELVNQKISSISSQIQIPDTLITQTASYFLRDNLLKDIKSSTGVEIFDYLNYFKIDDIYISNCIKNTQTVLESFSGITEMVSGYIIETTNNGNNGEGLMANLLSPSVSSFFNIQSIIELNESIKKSTQDMNKIITIIITITDTLEYIRKTANPKIKSSVEIFLRLLEPKITERYDSQYKIVGGKYKKTMLIKKNTIKKRKYCNRFTITSKKPRKYIKKSKKK